MEKRTRVAKLKVGLTAWFSKEPKLEVDIGAPKKKGKFQEWVVVC